MLWPPGCLEFTPINLLRSMCVVCVLASPGCFVVSLPRELGRGPIFVYVDAARDGGVYHLGLFSLGLGSKSAVPPEQPLNQQCAEARVLSWGLKFILNRRSCEVNWFGDSAAALVQFLRSKASVGRVCHQRLLKTFRYIWAPCPRFTVYCHWV